MTVVDNLDGTMTCTPAYDGGSATFTNIYEARGSASLKAAKTLENRTLEDKQFMFQLINDETGVVMQTVYNDAAGNITFSAVEYKKPGTYNYTIREVVQDKQGYTYDNSEKKTVVTVTDIDNGVLVTEVKYDGSEDIPEFANKFKASVSIRKVDAADGKVLEEATIQLLDEEGKIVEEWVSDKTPHEVEGLKTGEEYTLREAAAPDGYTVTPDTEFTIDEYGNVTSQGTITEDGILLIEDMKTKVKVSKVDIASGEELEGATLQILDKDENVLEEWTSTKEVHEIKGLKTGEEYTLRETAVPDGYTVAADTTFTIDETGKVTSTGTITEDGMMLVEDAKTVVKVSKVDIASGEELEGAALQILDKDENVLEEWTSTKEVHGIEGLKTGEEYTLRETAAPDGYTVAADTTFTIDETGKVTSTGTITEDGVMLVEDSRTGTKEKVKVKVKVSKVDIADEKVLEGATIRILDKDGNAVEEWISTKEVHVVEGLAVGVEYTLHEVKAPDGYETAADAVFSIDQSGKVTTTGSITEDGVLLIKDVKTKVPDKPDKPDKSDNKKKKRSPRTGDDGGAMLWLLLGAGAAGVIAFLNKKRKKAH